MAAAYFAPYIDATGFNMPTYAAIQAYAIAQYQATYGVIVTQDNSDPDYQWISIFSLMIFDAFSAAQLAYNARSPVTAIGADLDAVVQMDGIARLQGSGSTVPVLIGGVAGTVIAQGILIDTNGNYWYLPSNVTIPNGGSITVTAVCQTIGPITAATGTIVNISNPKYGWNSATNTAAATPGLSQELDSALRARQAISVALVAKTLVQSTIAAIATVPGVTRYYTGPAQENPTGAVDVYGNPPHSIGMVVEGGTALDIATAIYNNKTPGCLTNGTLPTVITDPNSGATMTISFSRPTYVPIYVFMNVKGLNGFTSATLAAIQTAVVNYLASLQIGENVTVSGLIAAAMAVMPNISLPQFSIQLTQIGIPILNTTFATTVGSNQITVASATGLAIGNYIVDASAAFVTGTTITAIAGTTLTLSNNAQTSVAADSANFFAPASADVALTYNQVAQGAAVATQINQVD